jgi:hypothetical protein
MHAEEMFKDCRLARMSDGHYCLVRDLGLVKGGKGLKHHEVVVDLTVRGIFGLVKRLIAERVRPRDGTSPHLKVEDLADLS